MKNLLPPTWQSPTLTKSDTDDKWLIPPIVDLCGVIANDEHATIESESISAYHNGILHICTPPASTRPLDNPSLIDDIRHKASKSGVKLYAIGL